MGVFAMRGCWAEEPAFRVADGYEIHVPHHENTGSFEWPPQRARKTRAREESAYMYSSVLDGTLENRVTTRRIEGTAVIHWLPSRAWRGRGAITTSWPLSCANANSVDECARSSVKVGVRDRDALRPGDDDGDAIALRDDDGGNTAGSNDDNDESDVDDAGVGGGAAGGCDLDCDLMCDQDDAEADAEADGDDDRGKSDALAAAASAPKAGTRAAARSAARSAAAAAAAFAAARNESSDAIIALRARTASPST